MSESELYPRKFKLVTIKLMTQFILYAFGLIIPSYVVNEICISVKTTKG